MDIKNYKCVTCGSVLAKKEGRKGYFYVCPQYKDGCPGFIYNPSGPFWRVASETTIGTTYDVVRKKGNYSCTCPAGAWRKIECKHKKWIKKEYEHLFSKGETAEEIEKVFYDLKEKGFFSNYKNYEDYKRGKHK